MSRTERIARNRAHVAAIEAATFCAVCGRQPIEWHRADHARYSQIGQMVGGARSLAAIDAELALCTPLCRACHTKISKAGSATHCKSGHPRTPENTFVRPNGHTECRLCMRILDRINSELR